MILCLLLCALPFLGQTAEAASPRAADTVLVFGHWNSESLDSLITVSRREPDEAARLVRLSEAFINTPYGANTLSPGPEEPEALVVNLREMDCFTFLDYLLALTYVADAGDFMDRLVKVRYKRAVIAYANRNHFFARWVVNNNTLLTDVTRRFPSALCSTKLLNKNGDSLWLRRIPVVHQEVCFVPVERFRSIKTLPLKSGDLLGFHTPREGLDVTHVGIAVQIGGRWFLRHASSRHRKVLDEPLEAYVGTQRGCDGIMVVRLKPG